MSWMLDLYETYEKNSSKVGNVEISATNQGYTLVPISHTYQAAQVEITITLTGEILSADVIQKEKSSTLIPCTIDSATRSNAPVPHPLHDKLMYVAGDYEAYGGKIKKDNPHQAYLEQLERWCAFDNDNDNEQIQAVYQYVKKGCLIADLVARGVLYTENGKLLLKWSGSTNKPAIFQALAGDQTTTFVRFKVVDTTKIFEPMWEDKAMFDSYIAFYKTQLTTTGLCYVTGKTTALVEKHPSKLRYAGDMAKLISANDTNGYTYRGLFSDKNQVATISYEASQKAHNALKWLITRQGKVIDGRVFLFWSKENLDVVSVDEDLASQFGLDLHTREDEETADTAIEFARAFKYAAQGYRQNLTAGNQVILLVLDAPTKGRLAVINYQKIDSSIYLENVQKWYEKSTWRFLTIVNKTAQISYRAPTIFEIASAAYGKHAKEQLLKLTHERLQSAIINNLKVPVDLLNLLVQRTIRPTTMESWEWDRQLSITCSMIRNFNTKESYSMTLYKESTNRSYLYGRLLAVADRVENIVLWEKDTKRSTNASRYMESFSQHPHRTWKIIQMNISAYQQKVRLRTRYYEDILDEIYGLFVLGDFNDEPLSADFLIGFSHQRADFNQTKNKEKKEI